MLRRRVIAALLTFAVVMCTLVFSAAAENETCRISVLVVGNGTVTVNGTESDEEYIGSFAPGTDVTMTAEPDSANYEFLYWVSRVNDTTSRIVSWDPEYTFTVATYGRYEAVFTKSESKLASETPPKHTVVYLSAGDNVVFYQEGVPVGDMTYYENVPTSKMIVSGRTFNGWDKTTEQVAASEGRVIVHPLYETDSYFSITTTIDGVTQTLPPVPYLSQQTVVAPTTLNGEDFSCWLAIP